MENVQFKPPKPLHTLLELRAPFEWLSILARFPSLANSPKGDKRPVMLLPGYLATELSMKPLQSYLSYLGYDAVDWGMGRNLGRVDDDIERCGRYLEELVGNDELPPFTLIGWSLGGVIARELARLYPNLVREVITLSTPITGGPKYTAVAQRYAKLNDLDLDAFEAHVLSRNKLGFEQPVTAIYSKSDGVVGWQAAVDIYNAHARNIEVSCSHMGIGVNATVWKILANILAESADRHQTNSGVSH